MAPQHHSHARSPAVHACQPPEPGEPAATELPSVEALGRRGDREEAQVSPCRVLARAVDPVDAQPPQVFRCPRLVEPGEQPVPVTAWDEVPCVEHDPVADRDGLDPLPVGVPACLGQREVDGMLIPCQCPRWPDLDDELLSAEPGEGQARVACLVVHFGEAPVEDHREQVLEDTSRYLFRGRAQARLLREALPPLGLEAGPGASHPVLAPVVGGERRDGGPASPEGSIWVHSPRYTPPGPLLSVPLRFRVVPMRVACVFGRRPGLAGNVVVGRGQPGGEGNPGGDGG